MNTTSDERVAVVTGGARGIGRAIATGLANDGVEVISLDKLPQDATDQFSCVSLDLADPSECLRVMTEIGRVDILVNCAAILIEKPLDSFTLDEYELTFAVNLRPVFLLGRLAAEGMRRRGWGRLINISSVGARTGGYSNSAIYAASKAGMIALTKSFARFYGPSGITSNAVAPGAIDSPMAGNITAEARQRYVEAIPVGRFADPSEVASVVTFLAGDSASFINGATIDVNGGWLMV